MITQLAKKKEKQLFIRDVKPVVFKKMLEFIYDQNVYFDKNVKFVEKLLRAAENYGVEQLKVRNKLIWKGITNILGPMWGNSYRQCQ